MKIRISTIPAQGLKIKDIIPLEPLNARMNEGRHNDIFFVAPPQVEITVAKTVTGAEIKGRIKTRYKQPCSLCLDVLERELETEINLIAEPKLLKNKAAHTPPWADKCEDDIGIAYYEGDHIDLEDLIQESIILALSPFWHPACDENNRCTLCGRNLSAQHQEAGVKPLTLAALLKKAGI